MQPITRQEVHDGLDNLRNGCAKGVQGLPSELLRYAKLNPEWGKPPLVNVLVLVITGVLNAAFQTGYIPQEVNGGLITPVFREG